MHGSRGGGERQPVQLGQGIVVHGEAHLDIHVVVHLYMIQHELARENGAHG